MARSKGSLSTDEAKEISKELEQLLDKPFKYNFNYLRMIELLLCQRITEQICKYPKTATIYELKTSVEIPLIGTLDISPRIFHEEHGTSGKPSVHLEFTFTPTSGFKNDVLKAYQDHECDITEIFSDVYGEKLQELYKNLREGDE